jgi:hypothetical protein
MIFVLSFTVDYSCKIRSRYEHETTRKDFRARRQEMERTADCCPGIDGPGWAPYGPESTKFLRFPQQREISILDYHYR